MGHLLDPEGALGFGCRSVDLACGPADRLTEVKTAGYVAGRGEPSCGDGDSRNGGREGGCDKGDGTSSRGKVPNIAP